MVGSGIEPRTHTTSRLFNHSSKPATSKTASSNTTNLNSARSRERHEDTASLRAEERSRAQPSQGFRVPAPPDQRTAARTAQEEKQGEKHGSEM
jgi:hypothetical protein